MSEQFHLTVLALSREGYRNLVAWVTESMRRENFYRKPRISIFRMAEIAPCPLHHNVILSGCLGSELSQAFVGDNGLGIGVEYIRQMKTLFPNFYVELQSHSIPKYLDDAFPAYCEMVALETAVREKLIEAARATDTPLVLTNDSHLQHIRDRKAHVAMRASAWRSRDDTHYGLSAEKLSVEYLKDYVYFASYMRDMERAAEHGGVPDDALASIADICAEADIRLGPLDKFTYSLPSSGA
jgi:DNA polymerase III alpha subunit